MVPVLPSDFEASCAVRVKVGAMMSSLTMMARALVAAAFSVAPVGAESTMSKASSPSTVTSAATRTVTSIVAEPGAKLRVPLGSTPPTKSLAVAALMPVAVAPRVVHTTLLSAPMAPERVTRNTWAL